MNCRGCQKQKITINVHLNRVNSANCGTLHMVTQAVLEFETITFERTEGLAICHAHIRLRFPGESVAIVQ